MTWSTPLGPRFRVISDNDYAGDPDGLVQLAHHVLCTSVEVVGVIASHFRPVSPTMPADQSAADGALEARRVLELAGRGDVSVWAGSPGGLRDRRTPLDTDAARAIIEAAMSDDSRPLFVCMGAGMTTLASAWLLEPRIADRVTAVWIGGAEYPDIAPAPDGGPAAEYNTSIDPIAAQVVFNDSLIPVWQVPRDAYRQVIASMDELELTLRPAGDLGRYLYERLAEVGSRIASLGWNLGEIYVLGDSPLVSLTALQTGFEPGPASCLSQEHVAPRIADDGSYQGDDERGRTVRVFTHIDSGLIVRDLVAKLTLRARRAMSADCGGH